jgi:hypothetical protein
MAGDAVREALEAAAKRLCICDGECFETRHGMMNGPCEQQRDTTAAAIAAFLRALPAVDFMLDVRGRGLQSLLTLAQAVERAAQGGSNGT